MALPEMRLKAIPDYLHRPLQFEREPAPPLIEVPKRFRAIVEAEAKKNKLPRDLLALILSSSGWNPAAQHEGRVGIALVDPRSGISKAAALDPQRAIPIVAKRLGAAYKRLGQDEAATLLSHHSEAQGAYFAATKQFGPTPSSKQAAMNFLGRLLAPLGGLKGLARMGQDDYPVPPPVEVSPVAKPFVDGFKDAIEFGFAEESASLAGRVPVAAAPRVIEEEQPVPVQETSDDEMQEVPIEVAAADLLNTYDKKKRQTKKARSAQTLREWQSAVADVQLLRSQLSSLPEPVRPEELHSEDPATEKFFKAKTTRSQLEIRLLRAESRKRNLRSELEEIASPELKRRAKAIEEAKS